MPQSFWETYFGQIKLKVLVDSWHNGGAYLKKDNDYNVKHVDDLVNVSLGTFLKSHSDDYRISTMLLRHFWGCA